MSHEELYEAAVDAIEKLFSDTSVAQEKTRESLQSLIDEIEMRMDSLEDTEHGE